MSNGLRLCVMCVVLALATPAIAQSTQPTFPFEGEITGDSVYVRCGPGSNYYPTTKLQTGDRVRVLGEQFKWMRIAPPLGSFSYVDMTMIDKTGDEEGTIKGDKVNVYAGSGLSNKKHEVQTQLEKGAKVAIKGDQDGFYRILPPDSATLWVSGMYVQPAVGAPRPRKPVPTPATAPAAVATRPAQPTAERTAQPHAGTPQPATTAPVESPIETASSSMPAESPESVPTATETSSPDNARISVAADGSRTEVRAMELSSPSRLAPFLAGGGAYAEQVKQLEARLSTAMSHASLDKTELSAIQTAYAPIAMQDVEPVAKAIAEARVKQLNIRLALLTSRDNVLADQADLSQYRVKMGTERDAIRQQLQSGMASTGADYSGELRTTLVFPPETNTYRLVDTSGRMSVVAFVRFPPPLNKNIERLVGQYVTVRAAKREYNPTGVPLIVVAEIVSAAPANRTEAASRPAGG